MTSPSTCQKSLAPCILFVARKTRTLSFRLLLVLSIPIKDRIYDRVGLIPHETLNRLCARTVFIGFVLCKRFRRADGLKNGVEPTPHRITLRPPKVAVSPRVHDRSLNLPPIDVHLPLNLRVTKSEKSDQNREEHVPTNLGRESIIHFTLIPTFSPSISREVSSVITYSPNCDAL